MNSKAKTIYPHILLVRKATTAWVIYKLKWLQDKGDTGLTKVETNKFWSLGYEVTIGYFKLWRQTNMHLYGKNVTARSHVTVLKHDIKRKMLFTHPAITTTHSIKFHEVNENS